MKWEVRDDLLYTPTHEWCRQEGNMVTTGIRLRPGYAQGCSVELPEVGQAVRREKVTLCLNR